MAQTETTDAPQQRHSTKSGSSAQRAVEPAAGRWRLLASALKAQRKGLLVATAIGMAWSVGKLTAPQLTRIAIDRGIDGGGSVWMWSLLIAAAGVVAGTFTAFRRYFAFREGRWIETRLRERLFDHILRLHIGYHDRAQTGQLMSRASSDLNLITMFVVMVPVTLANLAMIIAAIVILFLSDPLLALVALAPLPLINLTATRFSRRVHPVVMQVQVEQAELAAVVEESVAGVRVIKGFGAEDTQNRRLEAEADDIKEVSLRAARIRARYLPIVELLPQLGLIAVLGIGGHRALSGQLSIGELVAFTTYIMLLINPLRMLGMTVAWAQRASVALERIQEVLTTTPEVVAPDDPMPLPDTTGGRPTGHVEFGDVHFGYDPDSAVLDGFDLDVPAGRSVALVGGTGSGKSTIARLLVRFYEPQRGAIRLDGIDIGDLDLHELRRAVGIVFEDTLLFHDTVSANIAFACPDADRDRVETAARLAGAHDFIGELPDGYETLLGERGYSLSGGQRQRIAIARAIVADPRVLILDDATSAVDPAKEHEIREAMRTVMAGRTTLVIAHRPGTIAMADTVVFLEGGVAAAIGHHDELVATNSRYRQVLASMATDEDARRSRLASATGGD